MSTLHVQYTFEHDSGLPADRAVNNWYFGTDGTDDAADAVTVAALVQAFYVTMQTDQSGNIGAVQDLLSSELSGVTTARVYRMEDAKPRFPLHEITYAVTPGSTKLPGEVAIKLSWQAQKLSGENQDRKRGGIFLGPLSQTGMDATGQSVRPSNAARDRILRALAALKAASDADPGIAWGVYSAGARAYEIGQDGVSRATGPLLAPQFRAVHSFWVDNAFDTQRRRGVAATTKWVQPSFAPTIANP